MILFIGAADRGYFAEEIAEKKGYPFAYISAQSRIETQRREILSYQNVKFMIFEISQYFDPPEDLAAELIKISKCNNAKIVIFAPGYLLKQKILIELYKVGVRNFILGTTLTEHKEQLEDCLSGYYEVNGLEKLELVTLKEQEEEQRLSSNSTLIGVAGSMERIGTTTQALQIVKYLLLKGYQAAYIEMNHTGYVKNLADLYKCDSINEEIGEVIYMNVPHYYRQDRISDVLKMGYDFYIYDYGVYSDVDFNKTSFLEKDIKIACMGSKPTEFDKAWSMVRNNFYSDLFYLFIFTPEGDKEDLRDSMEDKKDKTYFPGVSMEAYELAEANIKIYEEMIPVESKSEEPEKQGFFRFLARRKKG